MKRFLVGLLILSFSLAVASAQDTAAQEQIDKLSGQIQDMQAAQLEQSKRIEALEKRISDLQNQVNQPAANTANSDDLKKLAEQVQEIDKKRQEDNDRVLKELERLEKSLGASSSSHRTASDLTPDTTPIPTRGHPATNTSGPQNGYDYTIQRGDTLLAIVKAYRAQGIKVTTDQVLKANPGLDPKNLKVGQKIFIPAPGQ
ncbi:MAG TPA: LysM peptidoglycan-binding domain-containing protein [Candidatus Sulfopaludibacter sp.]|nr:LysM peptidoglycan-binding domain-containing protein [Candidatus Sulfopaludibacter sp.]